MFWRRKTNTADAIEHLIKLKISGLHCTSCSLMIDNAVEELPGVVSSHTSYATAECTLQIEPQVFELNRVLSVIQGLGYRVIAPPSQPE